MGGGQGAGQALSLKNHNFPGQSHRAGSSSTLLCSPITRDHSKGRFPFRRLGQPVSVHLSQGPRDAEATSQVKTPRRQAGKAALGIPRPCPLSPRRTLLIRKDRWHGWCCSARWEQSQAGRVTAPGAWCSSHRASGDQPSIARPGFRPVGESTSQHPKESSPYYALPNLLL